MRRAKTRSEIPHYVSNHNSMRPKLVIGFAAETNELEKNAIDKLRNKIKIDFDIYVDIHVHTSK